jgi:hypothetical protein
MAKRSEEEQEPRALTHRTKSALAAEADAHRQEEKRRRGVEEGSHLTRENSKPASPAEAAASRSSTSWAIGRH